MLNVGVLTVPIGSSVAYLRDVPRVFQTLSRPVSPTCSDCGAGVLHVQGGPSPAKAASPGGRLLTLTQLHLPAPSSRPRAGD